MSRETDILIEKQLAEMGFTLLEKFKMGKKVRVTPVRVGMPRTREKGQVFGPAKRNTEFPVDHVKVIEEKDGELFVEVFSEKARGGKNYGSGKEKSFTFRHINLETRPVVPYQQPGLPAIIPEPSAPQPTRHRYTPEEEQKLLEGVEEQKRLTAGRQIKTPRSDNLLPPGSGSRPRPVPFPRFQVRIELTIRSMPIRGVPVRIYYVEAINEIRNREEQIEDLEEEIKDFTEQMEALPRGGARANILNTEIRPRRANIQLLREQIKNVREFQYTGEIGKTDLTLGLLTLGPVEIEVPKKVNRTYGKEEGQDYEFGHWETPWGGMQPQWTITEEEETLRQRLEFSVSQRGRITARLIRPSQLPEPPIHPAAMEVSLPVERRGNVLVAKFEMTAMYTGGKAEHTMRPTSSPRGGYRGGDGARSSKLGRLGGHVAQPARALAGALAGTQLTDRELKYNPALSAAIGAGKRILHDYGEAEYERLFLHPARGLTVRFETKLNHLRELERESRRAQRTLRRIVNQHTNRGGGILGTGFLGGGSQKLLNAADNVLEGVEGRGGISTAERAALETARDTMRKYLQERDNYEKEFERDLETASARLRDYLTKRAGITTITIARRYKIPLRSDTAIELEAQLDAYAEEYAEELVTRGNTRLQSFFRGLRIISRQGQNVQEVWLNLLQNLFGIITGPWVLGSFVLFFEFFWVIMPYTNELPILTTMGVVGAVGLFLLNFEDVKKPLDWLTHLIAGGMIGAGTGLFLLALIRPFVPGWPAANEYFLFGMIWFAIAVFVGAFQLYQAGGYRVVFQMTVFIIVFAYFALGPYNGYYKATMEPVGSVMVAGFGTVRESFLDVWLLGTNPTEWAARQAVKNVRAEKPIDFPKGIEIEELTVLPDSVPGSESDVDSEFAVTVIVVNRGDLPAENIGVDIECNDYCETNRKGPVQISEFKRRLEPGESDRIQFTNLFAYEPEQGRSAEFQLAKVTVTISYEFETSSSLNVEVMNRDEIDRRTANSGTPYRTVVATSKATPAELSLNVGPQPLIAGSTNNRLLVSVLNTRTDGKIVLPEGTEVMITAPKTIVSRLACTGCDPTVGAGDSWKTTCKVPKEREIKYSEFKSIFAFHCNIDMEEIEKARTDLITAELPRFTFETERKRDIPITPPLSPKVSSGDSGLATTATCEAGSPVESQAIKYNDYRKEIDAAVATNDFTGVNGQALIAAIITQESNWNPNSVGADQDTGLMQVVPEFHPECGTQEDLFDTKNNINCGANIIAGQLKECANRGLSGDDLIKGALTNYNKGTGGGGCDPTYSYGTIVFGNYGPWEKCIKSASVDYRWPMKSRSISGFCYGVPSESSLGGIHNAIDIGGKENDEIKPLASGTVRSPVKTDCPVARTEEEKKCGGRLGNHVIVDHNDGRSSTYAHMDKIFVQAGQIVEEDDVLGTVGTTGTSSGLHLHLVLKDESGNPLNPCDFIDCSSTKCSGSGGSTSTTTPSTGSSCGDGKCAADEYSDTCPVDCSGGCINGGLGGLPNCDNGGLTCPTDAPVCKQQQNGPDWLCCAE